MKNLLFTLILSLALWSPSFAADIIVLPLGGPNLGGMVTDLIPSVDNTYDIGEGVTPLEWKDLWIDGTAHIDTIDADSIDVTTGILFPNDTSNGIGFDDALGNPISVFEVDSGDNLILGSSSMDNIQFDVGSLATAVTIVDTTGKFIVIKLFLRC